MTTWDEVRGLVQAHLEAARRRRPAIPARLELKKALLLTKPSLLVLPRVQLVLSRPEERLIVYGTLAPEGEYHHLLADLPATWEVCTIRGYMGTYRGYKAFQWHPGGPEHQAWLVTSPALPERCARLDRFEGQAYRRRLIPARLRTCLVIAQIYEAKRFV